jgi:hypothetical protein
MESGNQPAEDRATTWLAALGSGDPAAIAAAIYEIGEGRARSLAPDVLRIAEETSDVRVTEQAVWALGKLQFEPARDFVIRASNTPMRSIRRAAYWALGELSGPDVIRRLIEADGTEEDRALGRVIGGALKKLRGGTVRASASKVAKRAQPPVAADPISAQLLEALEAEPADHASVVRLREELQAHDPDLFERYMAYVREKRRVTQILDSDAVYRDR